MTLASLIPLALTVAVATAVTAAPATQPTSQPVGFRVLTYNIRNSGASDGANGWSHRREFFIETVRSIDADVIGMQEVLADQADYVRERLPDYGFVGTGRDDGKRAGEFSPILFRSARYELIDSGQEWLSPTPQVCGSMGWDAACTRIVTWATLRDRGNGRSILVLNTHWDHVGETARVESAKQMRRLLAGKGSGLSTIVMGDFNCTESDEPYRTLRGEGDAALRDTFRVVHPAASKNEASFNGFEGRVDGQRIDWILVSRDFAVSDATIDRRTSAAGRYASDHYPVTATICLSR